MNKMTFISYMQFLYLLQNYDVFSLRETIQRIVKRGNILPILFNPRRSFEAVRKETRGSFRQTCGTSGGVTSVARETISFITRKIAV